MNIAANAEEEKYKELLHKYSQTTRLTDSSLAYSSHAQQVASLASKRDASPTNTVVPKMLWPTSVSTERKYERKMGKKKPTPSFNLDPIADLTNTLP